MKEKFGESEEMYSKEWLDYFKELHELEIRHRDRFDSEISWKLSILAVMLGALSYLSSKLSFIQPGIASIVFGICFALSCVLFGGCVCNLIALKKVNPNAYLPSARDILKQYNDLVKWAANENNSNFDAQQETIEQLIKMYSTAATHNKVKNSERAKRSLRFNNFAIATIIVLSITWCIPNGNVIKDFYLCITGNNIKEETQLGKQNKQKIKKASLTSQQKEEPITPPQNPNPNPKPKPLEVIYLDEGKVFPSSAEGKVQGDKTKK